MFTVATPASPTDLTLLATVKTDLGITGSSEDTYLALAIKKATAAVCTYLRVPKSNTGAVTLGAEDLVETFRLDHALGIPTNPRPNLMLARKPATAVSSVVVDGTTLDTADYELDGGAALLTRLRSDRKSSWHTCRKIVVSYTAGYLLPDKGTDRTLPYDIEAATIGIIRHARAGAERDPTVKSEWTTDIERVEYWIGQIGENGALAPEIVSLLDPYRYWAKRG